MIDEIKSIYEEIKDLELVLTEYNTAKTELKRCEMEIKTLESNINTQTKKDLEDQISKLENDHINTLNEIKKIELCTKDCYKLSEIKAMFEFVTDQDVLLKKCTNFLGSLIYDIFITRDDFIKYFDPENFCKRDLEGEIYKIVKISHDLNELFSILKSGNNSAILNKCYFNLKMILEDELDAVLSNDIIIFHDLTHFYLIFESNQTFDLHEEQYFTSMTFANNAYLYSQNNIISIFFGIFKDNLTDRLLKNSVSDKQLVDTNEFFKDTEFFITNINEWALDCVMKEVIVISKSQKSNQLVQISEDKIATFIQKVQPKFLPNYISHELFRFLLCMNVFNTIESKRLTKAIKIIERALFKMMNHDDPFVTFADITLCLRIFSHLSINAQLSNLREQCYNEISRKSTDLTKNLQYSLILLKVYFKGKYFDFSESVKKFVPKNSQLSFEITFFNMLYKNVIDNIFCIKFLTNDKIADISEVLIYLLEMSFNIPKECIDTYSKFNSICFIFQNGLDETISQYKIGKIDIPNNELKMLLVLVYKESKTRHIFINSLV